MTNQMLTSQSEHYQPMEDSMIKVFNLGSDAVHFYSDECSALNAVAQSWADENKKLSIFYWLAHRNATEQEYKDSGFPIIRGKHSLSCGDWCAKY